MPIGIVMHWTAMRSMLLPPAFPILPAHASRLRQEMRETPGPVLPPVIVRTGSVPTGIGRAAGPHDREACSRNAAGPHEREATGAGFPRRGMTRSCEEGRPRPMKQPGPSGRLRENPREEGRPPGSFPRFPGWTRAPQAAASSASRPRSPSWGRWRIAMGLDRSNVHS